MKKSSKLIAMLLAGSMVVSMAACGDKDNGTTATATSTPVPTQAQTQTPNNGGSTETTPAPTEAPASVVVEWDMNSKQYVYKDSVSTLCTYWNPHDYETSDDSYLGGFIDGGLYDFVYNDDLHPVDGKDAYEGYKIIPNMAAALPVDVTEQMKKEHPEFNIPESATKGYAYTIDLNPDACWEDGTPINADTYVYSMQQLFDPKLINYRAADYFSGDLCIAGAENYFYGGRTVTLENSVDGDAKNYEIDDLVKGADGQYTLPDGTPVFFGLTTGYAWMGGNSLADYQGAGYIPGEGCWDVLSPLANDEGFVPVTDETIAALFVFTNSDVWGNESREDLAYYMSYSSTYEEKDFSTVGILKTGDYQITLVFGKSLSGFMLYYNLSGNWIVYKDLYEACKSEANGVWTTTYCTSVETTKSYGPYKLVSYQTDKALRLERNEKWYGYYDDAHVYVDPEDGETYRMYQTDVVECQVVADSATNKLMFFKGELMGYGLQADDFEEYRGSDYCYATPAETLFFFIFNGHKQAIAERENASDFDKSKKDLETMTLATFRKAVAVTYDKELFAATISPARSGGYGLIGTPYIYDPETGARYRDSDEAKQVLCDFYSVDTTKYASLDDAVASITGYDPVAAKELFKQAYDESLAAGYITDADGDGKCDQVVEIEYCSSATSDFITKTLDYLNKKLAEVLVGTPFEGKIKFVESAPYGNEWSTKIKNGLSDVVLAGWSGSKMNPFGLSELYTDPSRQYDAAWFDAKTVDMTLTLDVASPESGKTEMKELTMNLYQWSQALNGATVTVDGAEYCFGEGIAKVQSRLAILAGIEGKVLQTYDYIPMLQNASMALLSQQVYYVVEEYNAIMGRGGITYMKYNYTEDEWKKFIADQGGNLKY